MKRGYQHGLETITYENVYSLMTVLKLFYDVTANMKLQNVISALLA